MTEKTETEDLDMLNPRIKIVETYRNPILENLKKTYINASEEDIEVRTKCWEREISFDSSGKRVKMKYADPENKRDIVVIYEGGFSLEEAIATIYNFDGTRWEHDVLEKVSNEKMLNVYRKNHKLTDFLIRSFDYNEETGILELLEIYENLDGKYDLVLKYVKKLPEFDEDDEGEGIDPDFSEIV